MCALTINLLVVAAFGVTLLFVLKILANMSWLEYITCLHVLLSYSLLIYFICFPSATYDQE